MLQDDFEKIDYDGVEYADIANLIKVFSSTEYDSLEKAASEIIDNAIDANATNIVVFLNNKFDTIKGKMKLNEIAFLDDGDGMSPGHLQHIVGFGSSSRVNDSKIGKFGIGMNQASLFACKKFSVYSWTNEDEVYLEEFDSEYIIKNNVTKALPPIKTTLPKYVLESSIYKSYCKKHGTLVVWSNLKDSKIYKAVTVSKHMHNEFGRVYRYYINDNNFNIATQVDDKLEYIKAIDPMFLLENTAVLGDINGHSNKCDEGEPLFELFDSNILNNGQKIYDVPYFDKDNEIKKSQVVLRASIIKKKYYYDAAIKDGIKQPGDTEIGGYVKEFQKGITIVRNRREIDFNYFGFYDSTNQPQDRWFKMEILFTDELDEAFHVSNNKQHVELKKVSEMKNDYDINDPNYPMWLRLKDDIAKILAAMRKRNKDLASGAKSEIEKSVVETSEVKTKKIEESFEEIIKGFGNNNKNNVLKDKLPNDEEIVIVDTKSPIDGFQKNLETMHDDLNAIVKYVFDDSKWVDFKYDFDKNKYVIVFNKKSIDLGKFNADIEYLIVNLCIMLCDEYEGNEVYLKLSNLLNIYRKYLCKIEGC